MFAPAASAARKRARTCSNAGFDDVYQLDGGILKYLDNAGASNRFTGECFVFDQRVSVADDLTQGRYASCHACRQR